MSRERQQELASMGGKAAHANGKAHKFTSDQAKAAVRIQIKNRRKKNDNSKPE